MLCHRNSFYPSHKGLHDIVTTCIKNYYVNQIIFYSRLPLYLPAPSAPVYLYYTEIPPNKSHGPKINLIWSKPAEPNGDIRGYTVFYNSTGDSPKEFSGIDALSYTVDVLGGVTYQFHVSAVTIKPGPNATLNVTTKVYGRFSILF